jgi:hypothetical protein
MKKYSKVLAVTSIATLGAINIASAADLPIKAPSVPFLNVPFFLINDNRLTYAYDFGAPSPGFGNPNSNTKTNRQVIAFTHFDAWAYGSNAIDIGFIKFDQNHPAQPCLALGTGACDGTTDSYASIRSTFGFNEIFNTKAFSVGPLTNVSFEVGGGYSAENDFAQIQVQRVVAGLQFAFNLPYKGFLNIAPMVNQSWYETLIISPGSVFVPAGFAGVPRGHLDYRPTWTFEANYYMDLGFLPETIPLAISGRGAVIGPMGTGYAVGLLPDAIFPTSKTELALEPIRLTLDASKMAWGEKYSHFVDVWVAYRYRRNIIGTDNALNPLCDGGTCTGSSVYSGVTIKF